METRGEPVETAIEQSSAFESFATLDDAGERVGDAGVLFLERGRPRYIELELRGRLHHKRQRRLVPWDLATLDQHVQRVHLRCKKSDVEQAPAFNRWAPLEPQALRAGMHFGLAGVSQARDDEGLHPSEVVANENNHRPLQIDLEESRGNGERRAARASTDATRGSNEGPEEGEVDVGGRLSEEWRPPLDVVERDNSYVLALDIPGVQPNNLEIDVTDRLLRISGTRDGLGNMGLRHVERPNGRFDRRFRLPEQVDFDAVQAELKDGVLEVRMPFRARARERTIPLVASDG